MFRFVNPKSKRGQNTAEYALLIALVVAAVIAMQTQVQRAIQSRIRGAATTYADSRLQAESVDPKLYALSQYEPYYLRSSYAVTRNSVELTEFGKNKKDPTKKKGWIYYNAETNRVRTKGGFQNQIVIPGVVTSM